ncbi:hypothetical protein BB560_000354 [Smittium megazygosporum]|uniref:Peptidase M20 dimerisation domain-containing protein n=1 Tax=Smittium megazygosporum TaxID=133381 RepID=A0A2T9ZKP8_9FUNG|nr:hypothetical protein BB560_000354 [Smittium megazygosporum]
MSDSLEKLYKYVEDNKQYMIDQLREVVAIPSVSAESGKRSEVIRMGHWLRDRLEKLGAKTKLAELGNQEVDGKTIPLPPVVLGQYGSDPNKKTITIYGHYDVQPAYKSDGWDTEPFTLVQAEDGRLIGRGATDDKGPVLGWLLCLEAHQKLGLDVPVNLKFCFEGMEESGSDGLDDLIVREADGWLKGTDFTCISDDNWLGTERPCLTYGLRGNNYYHIEVSGPSADLHSGVFGGVVHEPMTALISVMSKLVDTNGKILIPGVYDQVEALTPEEDSLYNAIAFKNSDMTKDLQFDGLIHDSEADVLKSRMRYPSLSLHGIEGAFYSPGCKTVIPSKVIGKFSIRTVPDMDIDTLNKLVIDYVEDEFKKVGSKCSVTVSCIHSGRWWYSSPNNPNFVAGANAIKRIFNIQPDFTREGGSIPITLTFEEALKANVLLLPMGASNDGAHSTNEKLDQFNFLNGIKLFGAYWDEISKL